MPDSLSKYFFSGGVAGLFSAIVGHPMDTIKVRLQTMPVPKQGEAPLYTSASDCFRKTIKLEGYKGLYKGICAPIAVVVPIFSVNFFGFGLGKQFFHSDVSKPISKLELFGAGAFSGALTTPITVPAERVKCLLQIQKRSTVPPKYKGMWDCIKQLYAKGGIRSFYRGTTATFMRDVPGTGVYFLTYNCIKDSLPRTVNIEMELLKTSFAGGCAGMANWLVAMPVDVLKSRQQTSDDRTFPNSLKDIFKQLVAKEGPAAFYRGVLPIMIRAFPSNATCFVVFDITLKFLNFTVPNL